MDPCFPKLIFLARSLDRGGAERQLVLLAKALHANGYAPSVVTFYRTRGGYEEALLATGVRLLYAGKKGRWDILGFLWRMYRILKQEKPAILHGYLGTPNVLLALMKPFFRRVKLVWGVRASNMDMSRYDWFSRLNYFLECRLSRFSDLIIANSLAGKNHSIAKGFPASKTIVIPNGVDTAYFCFSPVAREKARRAWGIGEKEILVGLVGRLDPMKDHENFLRAARMVKAVRNDIRFLCVGGGVPDYMEYLKRLANDLDVGEKLLWLPVQDDMLPVYCGMDLFVSSSSFGEGFSNAIAEAMACQLPCAVTDVGDSRMIVGETGKVVPPKDEKGLAQAILALASLPQEERRRLGENCRSRIVVEFGIEKLVARTKAALGLH
jgi:glycosyltransferase involved in cell wall biosynthesis